VRRRESVSPLNVGVDDDGIFDEVDESSH
jgi:hypothetical protein